MKVFMSADIEGVSGVASDQRQAESSGMDYQRARRLMALDVNAAIEGLMMAGAKEIVVNDSHGGMTNLWPEDIHPEAQLILGGRKPLSMMQGIDASYDAAVFVGYHARAGSRYGTLAHTYSGQIFELRLNGKPAGETQVNGALAGYFGVPLILVTGDQELAQQVKESNPAIETAVVKYAHTRGATQCLHPEKGRAIIREAAQRALQRKQDIAPLKYEMPVRFEVTFYATQMADIVERVPGTERVDNRTVSYVAQKDYLEGFKAFLAIMSLSAGAKDV